MLLRRCCPSDADAAATQAANMAKTLIMNL